MSTDRLPPMAALSRHKRLGVGLVIVGIVSGVGLAWSQPTSYTAETRLAVGGGSLTAEAVPGFALASQQMASNYARYVNNAEEQGALEAKLGVRPGDVQGVTASPIPESNVLRVEVTGHDASVVRTAAAVVAASLIQKVKDSAGASAEQATATLQEYSDLSTRVAAQQLASDAATGAVRSAAAQAGANLQDLQRAAATAASDLSILKVQQDALGQKYRSEVSSGTDVAVTLTVVEEAVGTGDDRLPRLQQFGIAGAVLGGLAALFMSVWWERRASRRGRERNGVDPSGAADGSATEEPTGAPSDTAAAVTGVGQRVH
jgi:hypothetical protein